MPGKRARSDEYTQSEKPDHDAEHHERGWAHATWSHPVDEHHPDRHDRDEECREPRRHALLRPSDGTVAEAEHEKTGNGGVAPFGARRLWFAAPPRPRIKDRSRNEEASASHQERRNRFDGVAD